jgi:superfamily I DNA/RNA helicase
MQYLGNKYGRLGDSDKRSLTYVMTYHSAKGLDFKTVFLPYLDSDQIFWHKSADVDRRLFFVAATRSRRNLFLSYSSQKPHPYVQGMPQNLLHMETCELKRNESTKDEEDFFF